MSKLILSLVLFVAAPAMASPAVVAPDAPYTELRSEQPSEEPAQEPWYFLGCVNSDSDCSWLAIWYGFKEWRTEFEIRCRTAMYACYARQR